MDIMDINSLVIGTLALLVGWFLVHLVSKRFVKAPSGPKLETVVKSPVLPTGLAVEEVVIPDTMVVAKSVGAPNEKVGSRRKEYVVIFFVVLGMLSSVLLRQLSEPSVSVGWIRQVVVCGVVLPLILRIALGSDNELRQADYWRLALNSYQSGFMWQTLSGITP